MFGISKHKLHHKDGFDFLKISNKQKSQGNLVFIHGMFGGLSNFDPLIDYLEDYTIYVPDIPLYELDKAQLTIPKLADWLHDFLEAANIKSSVMMGNSMGGHVALEFAYQYAENVEALILTGSSGLLENDFGTSVPKRKSREYITERANMTFYDDLADDVIVDEILDVVNSRTKLLSLLQITRSTHSHNMEDRLPDIKQPALLVWGKQDIVTPPKVARQFKSLLPNAKLKWIDQCGHAPMMERPEQYASIMKEFLLELKEKNRPKEQIL